MRAFAVATALVSALLVAGCTSGDDRTPADPASPTSTDTAAPDATASGATASPSPSPTPTEEEVAFGTGTVTVDGTELPVSGDCDISRDFGNQPVQALDDEVDVLLAVDNVTGDGGHDGPFALRVRLLGSGAVGDRTVTSQGAPGADGATADVTYEGDVQVAELQDRRELEFVDAAVLHLEAGQQRVAGSGGAARRQLVVDVICPISRPE